MIVSFWNLTGISAALLPRWLSNFRAIRKVLTRISRLRDFTRSCGKTSYRLVNRGPGIDNSTMISRITRWILTGMIATLLAPWREKADFDKWKWVHKKLPKFFCILAGNYLQFDTIELTSNVYLVKNITTGKSHMHSVCVKIREMGPFGSRILQYLWK